MLYLIFNVIFGQSDTTYRQHLSAVAHVFWISLLGGLILFPLQVSKGDLEIRLDLGVVDGANDPIGRRPGDRDVFEVDETDDRWLRRENGCGEQTDSQEVQQSVHPTAV